MIAIGTTKFASNNKELAESLFKKGGTANGTYKVLEGRIHFYNGKGNLFAALIYNKHNERFFVTATMRNKRAFYMYGLSEKDKATLGMSSLGYTQEMEQAEKTYKELLK